MRAAVFHEYGGPLTVEEVPDPAPPDDGVVLEVGATGICRSDWHAWQGHDPDVAPPHIPGHELAGTVVAVGPGGAPRRRRRPRDGPVLPRLRRVRVVPGGRDAGLRPRLPAGLHRPGLLGALRRAPARGPQRRRAAGGARHGRRRGARLPLHDRLGRRARPRAGRGGGVGRRARLRRRGPLGGDDRRGRGRPRRRRRHRPGEARPRAPARRRGRRRRARRRRGGRAARPPAAARTSRSTRSGSAATAAASVESLRKRGRHVQVGLMLAGDSVAPVPMAPRDRPRALRSTASTAWPSATTRSCSARSPPASSTRRSSSARRWRSSEAGAELGRDGRLRPHGRDGHHLVLSGSTVGLTARSAAIPTLVRAGPPGVGQSRACAASASATASADPRLTPRSPRGCTPTPSWATWSCCTRSTRCCSRTRGSRRPRSARCSSIWSITGFVLEVPSGVWADAVSRRAAARRSRRC